MNALFVITLYTSFFSFVICFITMIISILTIVRRFDKQFKDAHVPGHLNIAFYGHAQRSGLYSAAIVINRNTRRYLKRYKKGAIYKYYGNFDFRAHCSSFEICNAYIHCYSGILLFIAGILFFIIDYFI